MNLDLTSNNYTDQLLLKNESDDLQFEWYLTGSCVQCLTKK